MFTLKSIDAKIVAKLKNAETLMKESNTALYSGDVSGFHKKQEEALHENECVKNLLKQRDTFLECRLAQKARD